MSRLYKIDYNLLWNCNSYHYNLSFPLQEWGHLKKMNKSNSHSNFIHHLCTLCRPWQFVKKSLENALLDSLQPLTDYLKLLSLYSLKNFAFSHYASQPDPRPGDTRARVLVIAAKNQQTIMDNTRRRKVCCYCVYSRLIYRI